MATLALSGLLACEASINVKTMGGGVTGVPKDECAKANGAAVTSANCGALAEEPKGPDFEITGRSPLVVSPGTKVAIEGRNFRPTMKLAALGLQNGVATEVQVESEVKASFVMPDDGSFGPLDLALTQDGATQRVSVFFDGGKTDHPIMTADAAEVCAGVKFYEAAGSLREGAKDCSPVSALTECKSDGQTDCRAVAAFPAVDKASKLVPNNIKAGVTIAGVTGEVSVAGYSDCASDGATDCVATATFVAVDKTKLTASNLAAGVTIAGVAGAVVPKPADCSADGETGCVTVAAFKAAKMANFAASDIRDTVSIAGVTGSLSGAPENCSVDGETGCLATAGFTAAATAGLGSKVLSTATVAGVTGNVTLPAAANVYTGIQYGIGGTGTTGTLTIPATGNVLSSAGAYGVGGTGTTPTLILPAAGKVLSGIPYGVAGNGSTGTLTLPAAGNVLTGSGTYGDPGAAVTPTLTLPVVGDVYTGIQYGVAGTGSTGTLTVASAANVRTGQGAFGRGGNSVTPTLVDCSADGGTSCVVDDGTNYKAASSGVLLAGNIKRGVQIGGVTGNFPSATSPMPRYSDSGATTNTQADGGIATNLTNFITQLTTDGNFEFWDSTGIRRTGTGDSDIVNSNVVSGIDFENLSIVGSAAGGSNCTDAGQIGCLTTSTYRSTKNFRNTARSATAMGYFDNTTTPAGAGLDIYDTIDDYNNAQASLPPDQPWGATYAADSSYWTAGGTDVTTPGLCNHLDDQCVYTDKITGLMWSEMSENLDFSGIAAASWPCGSAGCTQTSGNVTSGGGSGAYAASALMRWWDAIYACNQLNSMNFGGYNTGWRLPTQKELMEAHVHGIRSVWSNNFIASIAVRCSASTISNNITYGWCMNLASGTTTNAIKTNVSGFVCIR